MDPAVIWIGLLSALIHQTKTQSSLLVVFEVILTDWDMFTSGKFDMEVIYSAGDSVWSDIKYCWSGIYEVSLNEDSRGWKWVNAENLRLLDKVLADFYFDRFTGGYRNYRHLELSSPAGLGQGKSGRQSN